MNRKEQNQQENLDRVAGRNAVLEVLKHPEKIDCIYIAKGPRNGSIGKILSAAREKKILIKEVSPEKLDMLSGGINHQGVVASVAAFTYSTLEEILENAAAKGRPPFLVLADEIEDPHNLGAIIRTAEACGVDGILIPKRRSVGLTAAVYKTSAGAAEFVPVAKVTNLSAAIDQLKDKGFWIYGADRGGQNWCETDYTGSVALVIGSEGNGIGKNIREKCDFIVSLPMLGNISSLNASVAAGVFLYEIARQRSGTAARNVEK